MDDNKELPTISQTDFDSAVGQVTSFFQSKRAKLTKQVTHWYGKFMICKAENNSLRKKNRQLCNKLAAVTEESVCRQIQLDKLVREVESIKSTPSGVHA